MAASASASTDATPHATVVFVGHHQSGKSTAAGHILVKLGGVDRRAWERVERETSNRPTSRYAWILDRWRQERERGTTLDLKLSRVAIPGPSLSFPSPPSFSSSPPSPGLTLTLVDTPGHPDYLKNTIAGITQADVAVLVVDGRPAVLVSPSSRSQTRELAQLATNLANQRNLVVAINFLDVAMEADPARGEQRFWEAVEAVRELTKRQCPVFVPVSGYAGDNLTERSPRLAWWDGPTLTGAIAAAVAAATPGAAPPALPLPLRIPLIGVYKVGGIGTVPAGRLAGGAISQGTSALLLPPPPPPPAANGAALRTHPPHTETEAAGEAEAAAAGGGGGGGCGGGGGGGPLAAVVRSIESFHDGRAAAAAGEWVGMCVKGVHVSRLRRGCVICDPSDRPARLAESFTAKVQILQDPTSKKREGGSRLLRPGYVAVLHVHTAQAPCRLVSIRKCNNKGEVLEAAATSLREGDIALVELRPLVPLVVEPFRDFPALGRFAVRAAVPTSHGHAANPLAQMGPGGGGGGGGGGGPMGQAGGMTPVIVALGRVEAVKYVEGTAAQLPATSAAAQRHVKAAAGPSQQPQPQQPQPPRQEQQSRQKEQPPTPTAATSSVPVHVEAAPAEAVPVAEVPVIDISSNGGAAELPVYNIDYDLQNWLRRRDGAA